MLSQDFWQSSFLRASERNSHKLHIFQILGEILSVILRESFCELFSYGFWENAFRHFSESFSHGFREHRSQRFWVNSSQGFNETIYLIIWENFRNYSERNPHKHKVLRESLSDIFIRSISGIMRKSQDIIQNFSQIFW